QGSTSAVPSNPNSRLGRCKRSPVRQGWDKMDAHFVGIDVSQDWLDVHVVPPGESFRSKNTSDGIDELAARLRDLAPERVAPEATGGRDRLAAAPRSTAVPPVVLVNRAQRRAIATALSKDAKTDTIDAQAIAVFAVASYPLHRTLPDAEARLLADLVAR